jgi:hypothetical protein
MVSVQSTHGRTGQVSVRQRQLMEWEKIIANNLPHNGLVSRLFEEICMSTAVTQTM